MRSLRPPLLYYRRLLRAVWKREDPGGSCLKELLGFDEAGLPFLEEEEEENEDGEVGGLFIWKGRPPEKPEPTTIGPVSWKVKETETVGGLPVGTPVVDGNTGTINWEFGCQFQSAIYYLMQERWRAKTCPWGSCSKYFVADKVGQKYCSTKCCGERKQKQARDYFHRLGKARRQESKATRAGAHRRKS